MIDFLISIFEHFVDPKKRIFLGYIILSVIIAFIWLIFMKKFSLVEAFLKVFDKRIFFSKSSKSDYLIFFLNRVFTLFISPMLITQIVIATFIFHALHQLTWLDVNMFKEVPKTIIIGLFTLFIFLLDDLTKYFVHRWMHKYPILWALHKVHHSATELTPLTIYRTHPLEGIVFSLRSAFTQGLAISVFFFLFGDKVSLATVLGVNVVIFLFNVAGSNLRHSHIGIRYWRWLEYILISPAQHQLHHSIAKEHHDKNFGATLAIWDWAFKSHHYSTDTEKLTLGLGENQTSKEHSLYTIYISPIVEVIEIIRTKFISSHKNTKKMVYRFLKIKRQINKNLIRQRKDNTDVKI